MLQLEVSDVAFRAVEEVVGPQVLNTESALQNTSCSLGTDVMTVQLRSPTDSGGATATSFGYNLWLPSPNRKVPNAEIHGPSLQVPTTTGMTGWTPGCHWGCEIPQTVRVPTTTSARWQLCRQPNNLRLTDERRNRVWWIMKKFTRTQQYAKNTGSGSGTPQRSRRRRGSST